MIKAYKNLSPAGKLIRSNILQLAALVSSLPILLWGYTKVKQLKKGNAAKRLRKRDQRTPLFL